MNTKKLLVPIFLALALALLVAPLGLADTGINGLKAKVKWFGCLEVGKESCASPLKTLDVYTCADNEFTEYVLVRSNFDLDPISEFVGGEDAGKDMVDSSLGTDPASLMAYYYTTVAIYFGIPDGTDPGTYHAHLYVMVNGVQIKKPLHIKIHVYDC